MPLHHPSPIDRALALACSGSSTGFTRLYEMLAGEIAAFCSARAGHDVDELVNEVFLGAFRGLPHFEGDGAAFRAYLYRIARNKLADHHGRRRRAHDRLAPLDDVDEPITADNADAALMRRLDADLVDRLLDCLTDDQRDVILLRFLAELSIAEVCAVLDRPETAVKALQRRAIARLRREMSALGGIAATR